MTTIDLVSLIISLVSGTVSITLGIFAIWLSKHFDSKSTLTLEKVNDLATEIKALVNVSITQQKDFSVRMLDSILSKDNYGNPSISESTALEDAIQRQFDQIENKIIDKIDDRLVSVMKENKNGNENLVTAIGRVRIDLKKLITEDKTKASLQIFIPEPLLKNKENLTNFPAHVLLITAIVKENIDSLDKMSKYLEKYTIPESGWEGGINNLINWGILEGDLDKFIIPNNYVLSYASWIDKNWALISYLREHYSNKSNESSVSLKEIEIAKGLLFE